MSANLAIALAGLAAAALAFPEWFGQPSLMAWSSACALLSLAALRMRR